MAMLGHGLEDLGVELGSKENTECLLNKRGRTYFKWNFCGTSMDVDIVVERRGRIVNGGTQEAMSWSMDFESGKVGSNLDLTKSMDKAQLL